jgi:hypothetical protein
MNEPYPWYGLVHGDDLQQGDLLDSLPLMRPSVTGEILQFSADVIVLSQSCDLAQNKLEIVQACPGPGSAQIQINSHSRPMQ